MAGKGRRRVTTPGPLVCAQQPVKTGPAPLCVYDKLAENRSKVKAGVSFGALGGVPEWLNGTDLGSVEDKGVQTGVFRGFESRPLRT